MSVYVPERIAQGALGGKFTEPRFEQVEVARGDLLKFDAHAAPAMAMHHGADGLELLAAVHHPNAHASPLHERVGRDDVAAAAADVVHLGVELLSGLRIGEEPVRSDAEAGIAALR